MSRAVLLVGMAPNRSGEGVDRALTGEHTRRRLEGYAGGPLLDLVDTVNLLSENPGAASTTKWDRTDVAPAGELVFPDGVELVVGLGTFVRRHLCRQLEIREPAWFVFRPAGGALLVFSPHPAGTSTWWNDLNHRARGEQFWRTVRAFAAAAAGNGDVRDIQAR